MTSSGSRGDQRSGVGEKGIDIGAGLKRTWAVASNTAAHW